MRLGCGPGDGSGVRGSEDGERGSERVRVRLNAGGLLSAGLRESMGTRKADSGDMGMGSVSVEDGVLGVASGGVDIVSGEWELSVRVSVSVSVSVDKIRKN